MTTGTTIFMLFLITLGAALGFGIYQYRRTDDSQKANGDDPHALHHKLQREQAEVEAARGGTR